MSDAPAPVAAPAAPATAAAGAPDAAAVTAAFEQALVPEGAPDVPEAPPPANGNAEPVAEEAPLESDGESGGGAEGASEEAPRETYAERLARKRQTWKEQAEERFNQERSAYEQRIADYERRLADVDQGRARQPQDPLEAMQAMARARGMTMADFYQHLGDRLVSGGADVALERQPQQDPQQESKLEKEFREFREQMLREREEARQQTLVQQAQRRVHGGVRETLTALQAEKLPWLEHANMAAVERKALELWNHAVFNERPGRFDDVDTVMEALDEHFTMVHASQLKPRDAAPAPANGNGKRQPGRTPARRTPPRASEQAPGQETPEQRAQRITALFEASLSDEPDE